MKTKLYFFVLLFFATHFPAQKLAFNTLMKDGISIRAVEIWKNRVYYSGTNSKFGYVSLKDSADKKQIKLSDKKLQFRTLAQNRDAFFTINIESPAYFFRIGKQSLRAEVIHTDETKNAFYDALYYSNGKFYTFSDPEDDLSLKFKEFQYNKEFSGKDYPDYYLKKGEAAFAASNTNIASSKKYVWLATGGAASRVFRLNLKTKKIEILNTPFVQGASSQGIYSIDFYKGRFGIAVGGDYTRQNENRNNIATTFDAGKTWQIQASGKNSGYKTCVKIRPGSRGKEIIAVGDQNIEFSKDFGKTWTKISDEKNLYVCQWVDRNTLVFAGKDRVIQANFKD